MNKYMYIIPSVEIIEIKASGVLMGSKLTDIDPSTEDSHLGAPQRRVF